MINEKILLDSRTKLLKTVNIPHVGSKFQGKVRDIYHIKGKRILITTDRISAFDRVLGYIPYKGQVLNQLSAFWFEKTKDLVDNHLIQLLHPNVILAKEAKPYSVEMVVRGYITGVTKTALWYAYEKGEREIYGIKFPDGLKKNQKLPTPVITPTTKAEHGAHDEKLTKKEIIKRKLLSKELFAKLEEISLALYKRGNEICGKQGLILVDTKYEFGEYQGKPILIDEIHTPDSSRFWKKDNYLERFKKGLEPENFDKEFFRLWYTTKNYRGDGPAPKMSKELQIKTAARYIKIYELITGKKFIPEKYPLDKGILKAINNFLI